MTQARIIIIAKEPRPGHVKTRLIPALGETGAARLADQMLRHTLRQALDAGLGPVELCVSPDPSADYWQQLEGSDRTTISPQTKGNLGQRMAATAKAALHHGLPVILIGTDCPDLSASTLRQMADRLQHHDACLCPVADGGYALLGLRRFHPSLFEDIPWSTGAVARITRQRLTTLAWRFTESETLNDIDEPEDLEKLMTEHPDLIRSIPEN